MNWEPIKQLMISLLAFAGGYFINQGWLTSEQWAQLSGAAITVLGIIFAIWKGTQSSMISSTAALPKVDEITTNDRKIADNSPDNVVASPGAK